MAAPFVAGEAALLRAAFPNITNRRLVDHIARHSASIPGDVRPRIDVGDAVTTTPEPEPSPSPTPSPTATPTPTPSPSPPIGNPIDDPQVFVRQQYLDFLNREPDSGGWPYWASQITGCPAGDLSCVNSRRIDVSAAFFVEAEFHRTGGFVSRFYESSLGRQPSFAEFMADRTQIVEGPQLESTKLAFASAWVQRTVFLQAYPPSLDGPSFINALLQTVRQSSGADLSGRRDELIADWNLNQSRASLVRMVADDPTFMAAQYNPSFVLMQYFGYLRRDPDPGGYLFWLDVLNNRVSGNYRSMVCAFLTSSEYQQRFGSIVTRSNSDCGP